MKKIVVLGNSLAAVRALELIRQDDPEAEMTIITFDGHYPYKRELFAKLITKEVQTNELFYRSQDFYEKNRIQLISKKLLTRINCKRQKIFLEDEKSEEKSQVDYDVLLITGLPNLEYPDIKGTNKNGVLSLQRLDHIDRILQDLAFTDAVIFQADSLEALSIAAAVTTRKKEALFIVPPKSFLKTVFDDRVSIYLVKKFEEKGLRLILDNNIAEILGDGDAKAVRLQSGKVFATEMIVFGDILYDFNIFQESSLTIDGKIMVNENCRTNLENVFALDLTAFFVQNGSRVDSNTYNGTVAFLEQQGDAVGMTIKGQQQAVNFPFPQGSFSFEGVRISVLGHILRRQDETDRLEIVTEEPFQSVKIFFQDSKVSGAVLINAESQESKCRELVERQASREDISAWLQENFQRQPAQCADNISSTEAAGS